jgi:carboxypeptidase family protein/Big-like domain-containing protein
MRALNPRLRAARRFAAVVLFTASCHHPSPAAPAATLSSVAVSGTAPAVGATAQFSATATFSDGTTQSVTAQATWASSDTSVASVSSSGLVSGVAPGGADISATYQNVTGRARVTTVRPVVPTYTISGAVTDGTSGGILPNIDIQATDSAGKTLSTKTGSAGTYTIGGLAAGTVSLTASAVSYRATTLTVALTADERADIVLPRVTCTFTVSPTSFAFSAVGGVGTVTIASQEKGCTWTAKSNDSFLTMVSGASGLDNGTVSFSAAPNPVGFFDEPLRLARSGTLIIAGAAVTVSQDAPRPLGASYDPTFKAPVCEEVGQGCFSSTGSAGPFEMNQPNTIFSACPDGSGAASIESIVVATLDGSPLAAGKAVKINIQAQPLALGLVVYIAADALRASWVQVPGNPVSHTNFRVDTVLPAGAGLQAIRVADPGLSGGSIGPGPCATGTNVDNDDLVFRVQ